MKYQWIALFCLAGMTAIHATSPVVQDVEEKAYVIPSSISGVRQSSLLLNGEWEFKYSEDAPWESVRVPGEAAMQGYAIRHDVPFYYRKRFSVPGDFNGHTVILRFDGVYSHAKLSVNGEFVREHFGGFSRWETDVTEWIRPGKRNEILLEVVDPLEDISYASGYAHHPVGGILRDVTLFSLPENNLHDFRVETDLDEAFRDATLILTSEVEEADGQISLAYSLTDPSGKVFPLEQDRFVLTRGTNRHELSVDSPLKWDAEHPNLYTLTVHMMRGDEELSRFSRQVGFREIEVKGDQLFVNGKAVKLRGACRHDISPELGRSTTAELDSLDALLFKRANMNFVRTSHYPPTERFLQFCDRLGIYVECETAVCFVDTYRQKNYAPGRSQDSALFAPRYLGQLREMVKSFRSHASVLFWSIGNESVYGENFQLSYDWVKATDRTRPVIFSYPGSVGERKPVYDLLSMHYQDYEGNLDQWNRRTRGFQGEGIPVVFDEWAHPACYTYETLQHDPGIREFWGHSLEKMWSGLFEARGGLGGAIWGYVDEIFMLPEPKRGTAYWKEFAHTAKPEGFRGNCVGYGEWGIVDIWRRPKPEFWATKKAYSPVRLQTLQVNSVLSGEPLYLSVYNRFDHTNLQEISARYRYKGVEKEFPMPSVEPHKKGVILLPAEDWTAGEQVLVKFYDKAGELLDAESVALGEQSVSLPQTHLSGALQVEDAPDFLYVKGDRFVIPFSKKSGLIEQAKVDDQVLIERGPFLNLYVNLNHLSGAEVRKMADHIVVDEADWKMADFSYRQGTEGVEVNLSGTYRAIRVDMRIHVSNEGKLRIAYHTTGEPNGYLRETGLAFHLPASLDSLHWSRRGMWSYYPEGSFAGNQGQASLYKETKTEYGKRPEQPWAEDTHNYYYWADAGANCARPLTQKAKGMKENIYYYTLSSSSVDVAFSVCSPAAEVACRMDKTADEQLRLYVNNRWDYPEIAWGNYCKQLEASPCFGTIELWMSGKK